MLVTLREVLQIAEERGCAVGAFNAPNSASLRAIIEASEAKNLPVIMMHAQVHEALVPLDLIGPIMVRAARDAKTPICVHLDHGEDLEYLQRAVDLGFTGVMLDGSTLPYAENVRLTREAVTRFHPRGVSVEGEIGSMGAGEDGHGHASGPVYTDAALAERFVAETGIDALACSFGTVHGLYRQAPKLDYTVLERIRERMDLPLVMHGGSGVSAEDYRQVIRRGIRKINYFTYMSKAGGEAVRSAMRGAGEGPVYYHEVEAIGIKAMREDLMQAMDVFAGM